MLPRLPDESQTPLIIDPLLNRDVIGLLNRLAVRLRVGKRHSEFNHVGAAALHGEHQRDGRGDGGEAGGEEGDEGGGVLGGWKGEIVRRRGRAGGVGGMGGRGAVEEREGRSSVSMALGEVRGRRCGS